MASLNGLLENSSLTQTEQLVQAYKATEQYKIDALKTKKSSLETKQTFYNNLNSKIGSLQSSIDTFLASSAPDKFKAKSVTVSDTKYLTATANSSAAEGVSSVRVRRLASNDTLISDKLSLTDNFKFGSATGAQSFKLTINGDTKTISVDLTGVSTNEAAMKKIVDAVNKTEDIDVTASLIKDTSTTGRLTFTSKETGAENQIIFEDSAVLAALGITTDLLKPNTTERTDMTNNKAGYRLANFENLDSRININGIVVTRGSNTIEDALEGVKLSLLKTHDTEEEAVTLTTDVGTKSVEDFIGTILTSYNELLKFAGGDKTQLRGDSAINTLFTTLRGIPSTQVAADPDNPSGYRFLSDIGIKALKDGTLSIDNRDKLIDALKDDPELVSHLFTSADGFANKLENAIKPLVGGEIENPDGTKRKIDGLIKSRRNNLSEQIESTVNRTTEVTARIDQQAEILRKQYESMLKLMYEMQGQQQLFIGYDTSGYNSLLS